MQKDWFADMRHWVSECLQNAGYTLTRPPEQFKQFIFSAILRTETKQGVFYAKVANPHYPLFCHEPRTMQALAQIVPENIPAPFAIHPTQAAGIYSDFGNVLWDAERNRDDYRAVIQSYAKLQIKTASHLDTLEAAGCINRRLDTVKAMFSDLLQDDAVRGHLSDQQQHDLKNCQTKINQLCDELTAFNVPYTLVHGDFHDGNIALNDQKITFFDWTDACIAHPFIDICTIVDFKAQDADTKFLDFMRDTYLACWTAYEPLDRLQAIYKRAVVISAVHNLISYWTILINTDKSYLSVVMWTIPQYADTIVNSIKALETTP